MACLSDQSCEFSDLLLADARSGPVKSDRTYHASSMVEVGSCDGYGADENFAAADGISIMGGSAERLFKVRPLGVPRHPGKELRLPFRGHKCEERFAGSALWDLH